MKVRTVLAAICAALAITACFDAAVPSRAARIPGGHEELEAAARQFVTIWSEGKYSDAVVTFDETMKGMMPPDKMREAWESLIGRMGEYRGQIGTRTEKWQDYDIVYVTCEFASSPIDIKIVYDGERRISGLWFVPTDQSAPDYTPPPYGDQTLFDEEEISVGSGEWELPGTLTIPAGKGPFPAVVLVHGSGPNDRDETIGPNKPFRDLAWGLATRGVAVLRYDKRTKVHGIKIMSLEDGITVAEETIDDALLAVDLLRGIDRIDGQRIFVLGHSLGGMCIPRIGARDAEIAGLIMLAGVTRPLEDLLIEQYNYIFSVDGKLSDEERAELDKIEAQAAVVKSPDLKAGTPSESLPLGSTGRYWLDLRDYRPAEAAAALAHPLLVLQGERDYQVTMIDFENWTAALSAHPDATLKSYPALNHLFIPGEGACTPDEYQRAGHVSEEVVDDIAEWIELH
jgi:dienelactone hydrolase